MLAWVDRRRCVLAKITTFLWGSRRNCVRLMSSAMTPVAISSRQSCPEPSSRVTPCGTMDSMQREMILVVALVAAGWSRASAAQPTPSDKRGEPWLLEDLAGRLPSASDESNLEGLASRDRVKAIPTGTPWPVAESSPRFGSGLEDNAPVRTPNVFLQSGLEGITSAHIDRSRASGIRFGSGLEEDTLTGTPDVFVQSGLEELTSTRVARSPRVARFGSGLEDDAPVRTPSVFHQSGL
jgi:hypothetical protein